MLLQTNPRWVRLEFCCKASARACQETHDLRNTMKHQAGIPGIQKETRNIILHYFVICLTSLSNSCALTLPLPFFTPSPLMTPSSPNTKPSSLQGRCCSLTKISSSDWSSVSGPRPEPGRRHMTYSKKHLPRCIDLRHFPDVTFKQLCLDPSSAISSHPLPSWHHPQTKHQALAPSGPTLLLLNNRRARLEFCFRASARAWLETNDLRNTMKHTAHIVKNCKKYAIFACSSSHSHLKMLVPGSKNTWNNKKSMGHQGYTALPICYTLHF